MARGYFGIGVYCPKRESNIGTLHRSAFNFGASFIFTIGQRFQRQASDTTKAWRHIPLYHYDNLDNMLLNQPYACQLVGIELSDNAQPLSEFQHPERAIYLLGAEDFGLPPAVIDRCHHVVQIAGAERCLNVSVAGSIVIYDRITKA